MMDYKIYVQWSDEHETQQTMTDSIKVAEFAYSQILHSFCGKACTAILEYKTDNSKSLFLGYVDLSGSKERRCTRCKFIGAFIDTDTQCPVCKLSLIDQGKQQSQYWTPDNIPK